MSKHREEMLQAWDRGEREYVVEVVLADGRYLQNGLLRCNDYGVEWVG